MKIVSRAHNFYVRFERPISSVSLIGGFLFDALTLKRVDLFWENFWVLVHLLVVGACIMLINLVENKKPKLLGAHDAEGEHRAHFWLITVMQFMFGGLLSTFLVFYFRSATLAVAWPFLLVLVIAFIANERFKQHYSRLVFQVSLLYLSIFSFSLFIVPVLLNSIGRGIFVLSELLSLLVLAIFLYSLKKIARERLYAEKKMILATVLGIFIIGNILYFSNLIPPIPLSLKDGGIYHSVMRTKDGNYSVEDETNTSSWLTNFFGFPTIHVVAGDPVFAYSAIFSPAQFHFAIVHVWQYYNVKQKKWITASTVPLSVSGGNDSGYRTYSEKSNITPGKWRVNVKTKNGQVIGRLRFDVIAANVEPSLQTEIKR